MSRIVLILALLACLAGARPLLLLAAGTPTTAVVENVVASRGARNRVFATTWRFTAAGAEWRGRGSTSRQVAPGSTLRVRYFAPLPRLNSADTNGALLFHAAIWIVPAILAVLLAHRLR
ncbi:MAG: hypothetical protein IT355_20335 [Gemmatimonadaceae bacterium]|nr:hypothetical protein [Gemmatimonadaceae bacterium]